MSFSRREHLGARHVRQRCGAQLQDRGRRIGRVILAGQRGEQASQPHGIDAGDVLVELVRIEAATELARLALGDEGVADDREEFRRSTRDAEQVSIGFGKPNAGSLKPSHRTSGFS